MDAGEEFFARVRPLLGKGLEGKHVAFNNARLALPLMEMLHACMLDGFSVTTGNGADWRAALHEKNPWRPLVTPTRQPDAEVVVLEGHEAVIETDAQRKMTVRVPTQDAFTRMDVLTHAAWMLREMLDVSAPGSAGAAQGQRRGLLAMGNPRWPFSTTTVATRAEAVVVQPRLHIMVVGCGSLGSEAIRMLEPYATRWTLVDAAKVTVFNLNRQWFGARDVGKHKVDVLKQRLDKPSTVHGRALESAGELEEMLDEQTPDVVLLATGTHHSATLAEVLWRRKIPHVAVCCYPQARFFEVVMVDPSRQTACFECLRGHLYRGAAAPAPMTDEVANFVYSASDDKTRNARFTDLVAEPASRMDTFRAACVAARAVEALTRPVPPAWLARVLAEGTTCLLGATRPLQREDGEWAYGLSQRGQVLRLGLPDLTGSMQRERCGCCRRNLDITHLEETAAWTE